MKKVVYHISGFDCANCANKTERYLNKVESIESAVIDFSSERLFVTYKDAPLKDEELLNLIKKVEDDHIRLERLSGAKEKKQSLFFTKQFWILIARIITSITLLLVARFAFFETQDSLPAIIIYSVALAISLYDVAWKVISNIIHLRNPVDENLLLTLATIGAFCISLIPSIKGDSEPEFFDGVMVIILFQIGRLFEHIATVKSKNAISDAIDLRADFANLISQDKVVSVKPESLKQGDKIIVHIGEIVPVDGVIIEGGGTLDMSSLTGESMPVDASIGMNTLSGSILKSGSITILVEKVFADSTISKILEMVQSSGERKSKADKFITRFARIYTPSVLFLGISFALIWGFVTGDWNTGIFRGLEVLVVACPCAIVISVPLAYFAGIGLASKRGIVIKGANYMDTLARMGTLFIDKTGTLTYGNFQILKTITNGIDEELFMTYLLSAESRSNHPIAKAIVLHKHVADLALLQNDYEEIAGLGVKTRYQNHLIYAGNRDLLINNNIDCPEIEENGTPVYVACDGVYVGCVILGDLVRDKAKQLIKNLNRLGIKVVLLSGDKLNNVEYVAKEVGIAEYYAKLLPHEKTKHIEEAISKNTTKKAIAFAGDGINDTPSIIRADVGFAMGGIGSDVAVENSDVVIMQDHPLKIYDSIVIAKKTKAVAMFNIIFALTIKIAVMVLCLTINNFPMWAAVLADTGLTVLLIINSLLLIYRKIK